MADEMSSFDPDLFLNEQVDAVFETKYTLIPNDEYQAMIEKLEVRQTNEGQVVLDVFWKLIGVDDLLAKLNRETAVIKQGIFLDIEGGNLSDGANANVKLGQVREAVGQNKKGKPWNFNMLIGMGPVTVAVGSKGDFNNVTRVA